MEKLHLILTVIGITLGTYEVLVRFVPTVKDWTILGNVIKVLRGISDALNNYKK